MDETTRALGIRDRVAFVEQAALLNLVNDSLDTVTVNSPSGSLSLAAGKPVKVLGDALYDIPDTTNQGPLDRFRRDPGAPDADLGRFLSDDGAALPGPRRSSAM